MAIGTTWRWFGIKQLLYRCIYVYIYIFKFKFKTVYWSTNVQKWHTTIQTYIYIMYEALVISQWDSYVFKLESTYFSGFQKPYGPWHLPGNSAWDCCRSMFLIRNRYGNLKQLCCEIRKCALEFKFWVLEIELHLANNVLNPCSLLEYITMNINNRCEYLIPVNKGIVFYEPMAIVQAV